MFTGHETLAELATQADGIEAACRRCPTTVCTPFRLLRQRHAADEILGFAAMSLSCSSCGARVGDLAALSLWRMADGQPPTNGRLPH